MICLSVVICTYNRVELLRGAIQSLIDQSLENALYEIIVVNNASTDNTSDMVKGLQAKYPTYHILLVPESRQGSGQARNTGGSLARGKYLAFMDDDARASPEWLKQILLCFEEVKPKPISLGGRILPFYDAPKLRWFKDEYEIRSWGNEPRFLKKGESFSGSNMIFTKETFEKYNGCDTLLGVKGKHVFLGEETALFDKIWEGEADGCLLYYSPQLVVYHAVPSWKMSVSYILNRAFASGQAGCLLYEEKRLRKRLSLSVKTFIRILKLGVHALKRIRTFPAIQNWMVEAVSPISIELGRLTGLLGLFIPMRQRGI